MIYHCVHCDDPQNFDVISTHASQLYHELPTEYTFARCAKCNEAALFLREDLGIGSGFEDDVYYRIYPPHERQVNFNLPQLVRESYDEAVRCENAKVYRAAVVMVRTALEAICKEYDPKCPTIYKGLQDMKKNGVISDELMEWATELRVTGNVGAHATGQKISKVDAKEALDFLQAILEIFYDLRPKFKEMKDRKAKA